MRNDDPRQAVAFHDMTKYYPLSDTAPGDERIGIGDPATRTEAIWQKDLDIKPLLYKIYETMPSIALTRDLPDTGRRSRPSPRREPPKQGCHPWFPTGRCSVGSAC